MHVIIFLNILLQELLLLVLECTTLVLKISAITFDEDFDVLITVTEINMIGYYH